MLMDRERLKTLLDEENVDDQAYSLGGSTRSEAYVLEHVASGWAVFYSERGLRTGEARLTAEDEACSHLLELLLRDPSTRRRA